MSPSPSADHQAILSELFYQFRSYLKDRTCQIFAAPFDVRYTANFGWGQAPKWVQAYLDPLDTFFRGAP